MKRKSEINLPDYNTKKDILYRDYKDFIDSTKDKEPEDITEVFLMYSILRNFYSISRLTANKLKADQVDLLVKKINKAITDEKCEFQSIITYDKKKYGFIPNWKNITFAELVEMEDCFKRNDFIELTSILYRPLKGKVNKFGEYEVEEYKGIDENLFANITLDVVEGYMGLFTKSCETLRSYTLNSMV